MFILYLDIISYLIRSYEITEENHLLLLKKKMLKKVYLKATKYFLINWSTSFYAKLAIYKNQYWWTKLFQQIFFKWTWENKNHKTMETNSIKLIIYTLELFMLFFFLFYKASLTVLPYPFINKHTYAFIYL